MCYIIGNNVIILYIIIMCSMVYLTYICCLIQGVFLFVDVSFPCPSPHVMSSANSAVSITFGSIFNQAFLS
jgi:hypothetical protein